MYPISPNWGTGDLGEGMCDDHIHERDIIFIPVKQARQIVLQDLLLRSYSTFEYILSSILRNKRVREHLSQNSKGLQPLKGNAGGKTAGDEGKG